MTDIAPEYTHAPLSLDSLPTHHTQQPNTEELRQKMRGDILESDLYLAKQRIAELEAQQPSETMPDGVREALQRLIENASTLGPASQEDALLVAAYRNHAIQPSETAIRDARPAERDAHNTNIGQRSAWRAVVGALDKAKPDWLSAHESMSGLQAAVHAIETATWKQPSETAIHNAVYAAAPAQYPPTVTDEMVRAYLEANTAYWHEKDALPPNLIKWRNGTPQEATEVGLRAALGVAPTGNVKSSFTIPEQASS